MAWRRPGDKALSEPMMVSVLTHIYASRGLNELKPWSKDPNTYSCKTLAKLGTWTIEKVHNTKLTEDRKNVTLRMRDYFTDIFSCWLWMLPQKSKIRTIALSQCHRGTDPVLLNVFKGNCHFLPWQLYRLIWWMFPFDTAAKQVKC